jgi:AbrB family looped-hinge helix DNA binding protein
MAEKVTKVVQCDARGQIVIPKGIRKDLKLDEGAAFWIYNVEGGIFLKKIEDAPPLDKIKKAVRKE